MTARASRKSDVAIAVFYPGNSLMHQIASWASDRVGSGFEVSFADSLPGIRTALQKADVAIVDATEDPARAMEAFVRATVVSESISVAVYSETMHPGLELFVRSRGSLLLWGPMGDKPWQELFDAMVRSNENEVDVQEGRSAMRPSEDTARPSKDTTGDDFRRSA